MFFSRKYGIPSKKTISVCTELNIFYILSHKLERACFRRAYPYKGKSGFFYFISVLFFNSWHNIGIYLFTALDFAEMI